MKYQNYQDHRSQIRSGSCLLFKGKSPIARLIRLFTEYSHAAMILKLDQYTDLKERIFLSESKANGTVLTLMSNRIKDVDCYIFEPYDLYPVISNKILTSALVSAADDIKYDYNGLFRNIFGYTQMGSIANSYFCSAYIWYEWMQNGLLTDDRLTEAGRKAIDKNLAPRPCDLTKWINGKLTKIE